MHIHEQISRTRFHRKPFMAIILRQFLRFDGYAFYAADA